ncbi:MAG: LacI family DNA-binding transcriptional regulator [Anaerocolumna sp.]
MASIKELAAYTGLSPSTISIVLRGKAEERNIPPRTQEKVLEAAKILGYQPNIVARRLRGQSDNLPLVIAVFWATDFRAPMMVRFLRGLQKELMESKKEYELVIQPYSNDGLCDVTSLKNNMYNAAIICNTSKTDIDYLENSIFQFPIVLYNRTSKQYCTVNVDDREMGTLPAKIFAGRGHKTAAIITSPSIFPGMDLRINSFISTCNELGLGIAPIDKVSNSMSGGYNGAMEILSSPKPLPDCVFCASDSIAIGALRAFHKNGIKLPEDLELISIGNGDKDQEEYASTSLSVINLPMEEMAIQCLRTITDLIDNVSNAPYSTVLPIKYIQRESCGGLDDIH